MDKLAYEKRKQLLDQITYKRNCRVSHIEECKVNQSALRGRSMNNFIELWCILGSGGFTICVASTSFLKRNIGWWPQQPPTSNRYHWKIEFFIDPFRKRGLLRTSHTT